MIKRSKRKGNLLRKMLEIMVLEGVRGMSQ